MTIVFDDIFTQLKLVMNGVVLRNEPMAAHTTWRVGGAAELFLVPEDFADLERALKILFEASCPWVSFGYGGNLLVRDSGIRAAVIHTRNLNWLNISEDGRVVAGAGLPLMNLIRQTVQWGLGGIESLAGIPATLGGAVSLNVGAHNQEIGDVVTQVTVCSATGCRRLSADDLEFEYRSSNLPKDSLITEVVLQLIPSDPDVLEQNVLASMEHRRKAHPREGHNAGSVFKNPAVKSAWKLIDEAGLRGRSIGGARISDKHTNFILNDGSATAHEIEQLIRLVQETVFDRSGVHLVPEISVMGAK